MTPRELTPANDCEVWRGYPAGSGEEATFSQSATMALSKASFN